MTPGRSCPLHYRYPPSEFQRMPDFLAETIYVIGGLYGNLAALDEIERMAAREVVKPLLAFNGDFHWFDVCDSVFGEINSRVLPHFALRGNVETELNGSSGDAGCGCTYPEEVDEADVERSNRIMSRLAETARAFPADVQRLAKLPMHAIAEVGGQRIGIVHGDAESLAGWRFSHAALHDPRKPSVAQSGLRGCKPRRFCVNAHVPAHASRVCARRQTGIHCQQRRGRDAEFFIHAIWFADAAFSPPAIRRHVAVWKEDRRFVRRCATHPLRWVRIRTAVPARLATRLAGT